MIEFLVDVTTEKHQFKRKRKENDKKRADKQKAQLLIITTR